MGRALRKAAGGVIYHALNRANARLPIFQDDADYAAFENVLTESVERFGTKLLAWCVMPNHWHLLLWPSRDGELSEFVRWLTLTPRSGAMPTATTQAAGTCIRVVSRVSRWKKTGTF